MILGLVLFLQKVLLAFRLCLLLHLIELALSVPLHTSIYVLYTPLSTPFKTLLFVSIPVWNPINFPTHNPQCTSRYKISLYITTLPPSLVPPWFLLRTSTAKLLHVATMITPNFSASTTLCSIVLILFRPSGQLA